MPAFQNSWVFFALGSAFFAALTAVLSKIGVEGVSSNVATLIRTTVVLILAAVIVFFRKELHEVAHLSQRTLVYLILSGFATGASWLCYNRALKLGPVSRVAPIDKLSVVFVMIIAFAVLGETLTLKSILGGILIAAGAIILAF